MQAKRNSILCPNCRKLISTDEPECPYCGTKAPGSWLKNNALMRGMHGGRSPLTAIVAVSGAFYVLSLIIGMGALGGGGFNPLRILSPSNESLYLLGAAGSIPVFQMERWWTLLTANYLHGGVLHLLFNMVSLYQLGPLVVEEYGASRLIIIYTIGGAAGFLFSSLVGVPFTIGASASVCGLIGAMLYYGKSRGGAYGQEVYSQVTGWIVSLVLFGFLIPGINNWAHGGGLAAGAGLGWVLGYRERRAENLMHKMLAAGCVLATLAAIAWAIFSAFFGPG